MCANSRAGRCRGVTRPHCGANLAPRSHVPVTEDLSGSQEQERLVRTRQGAPPLSGNIVENHLLLFHLLLLLLLLLLPLCLPSCHPPFLFPWESLSEIPGEIPSIRIPGIHRPGVEGEGGKEGGREGGREGEYELWNYLFNGTVTRICLLNAEIHRLTCINHPLNMNHFTALPDRLSSTIQLELDMKWMIKIRGDWNGLITAGRVPRDIQHGDLWPTQP